MTAGNSLSFGDVRKACKRHADEFLREPKEHESYKSHSVHVSQGKEAKTITEDHGLNDGDTDVENALAALTEDDSTDLEEADVQEMLLAYRASRQLRGQQRANRGYRPVTGRTCGRKPHRVEGRPDIKEFISRTLCRICRQKGHGAD